MERWLIAEVRMYFKTSVGRCELQYKTMQFATYNYQYYRYLQVLSDTKTLLTESNKIYIPSWSDSSKSIGATLFGGGEWGRDSCFFFPLKYWVGSLPYGIVSQVIFKTKYRYINRAISSSIIKLWLEPAYQWFLVKRSLYTHHSHYISSLLI